MDAAVLDCGDGFDKKVRATEEEGEGCGDEADEIKETGEAAADLQLLVLVGDLLGRGSVRRGGLWRAGAAADEARGAAGRPAASRVVPT